jgi:type II secretory pathway pseudopilin PulG
MTLLEAMVALVILGASAAGALGVFQGGARSVVSADAWNRASATAASVLEETVRAHKEGTTPAVDRDIAGLETRVDVLPWHGRVEDVVVQVRLTDGRQMTVHRLVRSP